MRRSLALLAAAASIVAGAGVPTLASAQAWGEDPCVVSHHAAARNGAVTGGILGALVGSQLAGRGSHTEGAIIGGTVGAVAGHEIGGHSVACEGYPRGRRAHRGCHWITDSYRGRARSYEVCRGDDGYWRPR